MASQNVQAASQGQFKVRPYAAEGGLDEVGLVVMLVAMLAVAVATGFAAHIISQWFYLIVVFPAAIGLAVGATGAVAAKKFKVRSPMAGGAAGLLCGLAAMLCMHYFDYRSFTSDIAEADAEVRALAELTDEKFEQALRQADEADRDDMRLLRQAMKVDSFASFMDFEATQGVELKKAGRSDKHGLNLGYVGSCIYWLAEVGFVCFLTWVGVRRQASEPFCRKCQQWRQPRTIGYVKADPGNAVKHLTDGNIDAISPLVSKDAPSAVAVIAYTCPKCQAGGEVDLKVEHSVAKEKGKIEKQQLAFVTYPAASLPRIEAAFPATTADAAAVAADAAAAGIGATGKDVAAAALEEMGRK